MRSWLLTIMWHLCISKNFEYEILLFHLKYSTFFILVSCFVIRFDGFCFFRRSLGLQNSDPMLKIRINKIKWKKRETSYELLVFGGSAGYHSWKMQYTLHNQLSNDITVHRYKFFASPLFPIVCLLLQSHRVIAALDAAVLSHLLCTHFGFILECLSHHK